MEAKASCPCSVGRAGVGDGAAGVQGEPAVPMAVAVGTSPSVPGRHALRIERVLHQTSPLPRS